MARLSPKKKSIAHFPGASRSWPHAMDYRWPTWPRATHSSLNPSNLRKNRPISTRGLWTTTIKSRSVTGTFGPNPHSYALTFRIAGPVLMMAIASKRRWSYPTARLQNLINHTAVRLLTVASISRAISTLLNSSIRNFKIGNPSRQKRLPTLHADSVAGLLVRIDLKI